MGSTTPTTSEKAFGSPVGELELLAHRVFPRPRQLRERLVHDDDRRRAHGVLVGSAPARSFASIASKYSGETFRPSAVTLSKLRAVSSL